MGRMSAPAALREEVDQLPARQKQVILRVLAKLNRDEDIDLAEIARDIGDSHEAVAAEFARALLLLRQRLEDNIAVQDWLQLVKN